MDSVTSHVRELQVWWGGKKVFNILLDWQSAVTLSPLAAELWNAPSPPVEYINLSALWNLQIKHRGRRSENENVNLAGSAWGRGEGKRRPFEVPFALSARGAATPVGCLLRLWPLSFGSYLLSLNKRQRGLSSKCVQLWNSLVNSPRLRLPVIVRALNGKRETQSGRSGRKKLQPGESFELADTKQRHIENMQKSSRLWSDTRSLGVFRGRGKKKLSRI